MAIKLICFDFDGTIANTMPWLEKNAVDLFVKFYEIDEKEAIHKYRITTGLPFEQQVEIIFPENSLNLEVIKSFESRKIERMHEQELFPETKSVLKSVKEKGFLTAVSSSTIKSIIEDYTKLKGIHQFLDEIVGFYPGFEKGKHHFDHLMSKFGLSNHELMYIGDSKKDMERAFGSRIKFVARLGPMFSKNDFSMISNGNEIVFPTITSLTQINDYI